MSEKMVVEQDSKQRVAYDLMMLINSYDEKTQDSQKDKKYWLSLYCQCINATEGENVQIVLREG